MMLVLSIVKYHVHHACSSVFQSAGQSFLATFTDAMSVVAVLRLVAA